MNLNFILMEMTHLRYWMPLALEGKSRGCKIKFFVGASRKYNCPIKYAQLLKQICTDNSFYLNPIDTISTATGILFMSEKTGVQYLSQVGQDVKIINTTYQTDFIESYKSYIDKVDHVLMPSEFCADFYDRKSDKNLYLGIPKYDVELDEEEVLTKYSLPPNKKALIIWPKSRDFEANNINKITNWLHQLGFTIIIKTRGKDPLHSHAIEHIKQAGGFYFEDASWYPHTTQELLTVSEIAINFGSTTIEEFVMHNVPCANFDIKPQMRNGSKRPYRVTHEYLYNYDYCKQLKPDFSEQEFDDAVKYLTSTDLTEEFKKARQNHLFDHKDSCKRILDVLL